MLHHRSAALFFVAIVAVHVNAAGSSASMCQQAAVTAPSGSICSSGTVGVCSSLPSAATVAAALLASSMTSLTEQSLIESANEACALAQGSVGPAWTDADEVCPHIGSCEESGCSSPSAPAPAPAPAPSSSEAAETTAAPAPAEETTAAESEGKTTLATGQTVAEPAATTANGPGVPVVPMRRSNAKPSTVSQ